MFIRLLALCLMMVFAVPAGAHACVSKAPESHSASHSDCHESAPAKAKQSSDACGCAMHQTCGAPEVMGALFGLQPLVAGRDGIPPVPVLRGLGALPLSPPPDLARS